MNLRMIGIKPYFSLYVLFLYFFILSIFGKDFAYLHIQLGDLPLFINELALLTALTWVGIYRLREIWTSYRTLVLSLAVFLGYGFVRFLVSLAQDDGAVPLFQILKDSALVYQALWVLLGVAMNVQEWRKFFTAILLGVGVAQFFPWGRFLTYGQSNPVFFDGFVGLPATDSVSGLFPLAFLLWNPFLAGFLLFLCSKTILGQLLFFLKKNWFFSAFGLATPIALLAKHPVWSRKRRVITWAASLSIGMILTFRVVIGVTHRTAPGFLSSKISESWALSQILGVEFKPPESVIAPGTAHLKELIFHGDFRTDSKGQFVGLMEWRRSLWKQAWEGFLEAPVFGQGFGPRVVKTHYYGDDAVHEGRWISGPHNSFLTLLFRLGVVGTLPFLGMLSIVLMAIIKSRTRTPEFYACLVSFLSVSLYAGFNVALENPHNGIWFWIFLGTLVRQSGLSSSIQNPI